MHIIPNVMSWIYVCLITAFFLQNHSVFLERDFDVLHCCILKVYNFFLQHLCLDAYSNLFGKTAILFCRLKPWREQRLFQSMCLLNFYRKQGAIIGARIETTVMKLLMVSIRKSQNRNCKFPRITLNLYLAVSVILT